MRLRPRQKTFVERSVAALASRGNTLGVAPTGCHAPGTPILMFDGSLRAVEKVSVGDLTQQIFQASNMMAAADPRNGRYLTASALFRGQVSTKDVEDENAAKDARGMG